MVAIIKAGYSIPGSFLYNENKVVKGVAELLTACNYPMEMAAMTRMHRLNMLLSLAARNKEVAQNSIHISLNFAPGEQISADRLSRISADYMDGIGFGNQPYLVYQHHDAAHPHIHIVTTKVAPNGRRIETQNIGRTLSENARKAIEMKYGLVRAEDHKRMVFRLKPANMERAIYGKHETKQAISNVLGAVLYRYKFASVGELNAVLNLYNVHAETGREGSRLHAFQGLQYRLLDASGVPVGTPIKASLFHFKPTLKRLQKRFRINAEERKPHAQKLRGAVHFTIALKMIKTFANFKKALKKSGIQVVERKNAAGLLYGITYVDHNSRCVFNGSDLGKAFSANAIAARFPMEIASDKQRFSLLFPPAPFAFAAPNLVGDTVWSILSSSEYSANYLPFELRGKKKRVRKKRITT